jgi:hypothetical protein
MQNRHKLVRKIFMSKQYECYWGGRHLVVVQAKPIEWQQRSYYKDIKVF